MGFIYQPQGAIRQPLGTVYGPQYELETTALINKRQTTGYTPLTPSEIRTINQEIGKLKIAGVWAKTAGLFPSAAGFNSNDALLNWVNLSSPATVSGAPAFASHVGWTATPASSDYIDTGITAGSGLVLQNANGMFLGSLTAAADSTVQPNDAGFAGGGGQLRIGARVLGDLFATRNASTSNDTAANTNGKGFFGTVRNNDPANHILYNGVTPTSKARVSASLSPLTVKFCGSGNAGGASIRQQDFFWVGGNLSQAQVVALFSFRSAMISLYGIP